jgi:hypothetical protein
MEVNFLLKNDQILVLFNLESMSTSLDLGLKLMQFFLLLIKQGLSLLGGILLSKILNPLGLFDLQDLELLSIIHCFFDSLVNSNKFLIILHLLQFRRWLYLNCFNSSVKLHIQHFHLFLVLKLELFNFNEAFVTKFSKLSFPISVKLLELLITNIHVLSELMLLDVGSEFILEHSNINLK